MRKMPTHQSGRPAHSTWVLAAVTVATAVLAALAVSGTDSMRPAAAMPEVSDVFAPMPGTGAGGLPPISPDAVDASDHVATF